VQQKCLPHLGSMVDVIARPLMTLIAPISTRRPGGRRRDRPDATGRRDGQALLVAELVELIEDGGGALSEVEQRADDLVRPHRAFRLVLRQPAEEAQFEHWHRWSLTTTGPAGKSAIMPSTSPENSRLA
jgi:hypothetical protein